MSSKETIERLKDKQGVLDKIQNVVTAGYGTKEDLRELDKSLRDYYYADLKALRHRWEEINLAALEAGQNTMAGLFKKVLQVLDRVAEKVHRADYGYAGLMDRKGSIREAGLAQVLDYDKALEEHIKGIIDAVAGLHDDSEAELWDSVKDKVKNIRSLLLSFESRWDERERSLRPLEM